MAGDEWDLRAALVEAAPLLIAAIRFDGVIDFVSPAASELLGRTPEELTGSNVLELIHPDDLERALYQIGASRDGRPTAGMTRFRLLHRNGSWMPLEVLASHLDGSTPRLAIYGRNGLHQVFAEDILVTLLKGVPREAALAPVCDVVQWSDVGSRVAVSWVDETGGHRVDNGLPGPLTGVPAAVIPGSAGASPWDRARGGAASERGTLADLPDELRLLAEEAGLESYWIEAVTWSDGGPWPPATITIWTAPGRSPEIHAYGMTFARSLVELIMRWTEQKAELDRAALLDPLTGLANRRSLFSAFASASGGGALLYCDLDSFKPVNDELGHVVGDELLRQVARRLESCVRSTDLVARMGGDEFAVICPGAESDEADALAERIRTSLSRPFRIGPHGITIGVSIGTAHDAYELDERLLDTADAALRDSKLRGRTAVRWAPPVERRAGPHGGSSG
jgi:diguanylate cyclase (GGDEF)-like protein/PAS domain S-box-containing protein